MVNTVIILAQQRPHTLKSMLNEYRRKKAHTGIKSVWAYNSVPRELIAAAKLRTVPDY